MVPDAQKAVAIDLDGTLLDSSRSIGQLSLEMIGEVMRRGWVAIVSTARPVRGIRQVVPQWFGDFYWVACNGAWVLKNKQIISRVEMPPDQVQYWIAALRENHLHFLVEAEDRLFSDQPLPEEFNIGECLALDQLGDGGACKVLVKARCSEEAKTVQGLMPAECAYVVTDGGRLIQIAHRECSKLDGVRVVLDREGMELDRVIAFGDDSNDIPLVMGAGCGVAMGNAIEELKMVADDIAATNDEDGVGRFLKGLLNDEKGIPTRYL